MGKTKEAEFERWAIGQGLWVRNVADKHRKFDFWFWDDCLTKLDIKNQTKPDWIIIEDWQNINEKRGWFYTTEAEFIVFWGLHQVVILALTSDFRNWYAIHQEDYYSCKNSPTRGLYGVFRSSFTWLPISDIPEFVFVFEK